MKINVLLIASLFFSYCGFNSSRYLTRFFENDNVLSTNNGEPMVEQVTIIKKDICLYEVKPSTIDEFVATKTQIGGLANTIPNITDFLPCDITKFYIAADGNDTWSGHDSTKSWRTIAKLNTITLEPGDSVLFHVGDMFTGQVNVSKYGTESSPITLTSYGIGAKPIISGAETLTGWIQNGNIWACKPTRTVKTLYVNGTRAVIARIPNTGYYSIVHVNAGKTLIEAAELNAITNYWAGGQARTRTNDYTWENQTIASSVHDTLIFTTAYTYAPKVNWGVYVDGLKVLIDTSNEWYCDGDSIWYQPAAGVNPNTLSIHGIETEHGVRISGDYITVNNLAFEYQDSSAIQLYGDRLGVVISNNIIRFQNREAINCPKTTTSCHILSNTIRDCAQKGIYTHNSTSDSIDGNTLNYIGMYAGYGREANGEQTNQTAIDVNAGTSTYIIANTIDSVGYIGIEANGNNQLVKYNYILNTMQKLNDGGGIYSYSIYPSTSYNNTWRRNIIVNTGANWWEATPSTNTAEYGDANALYLDGYTRKTLVDSNTVINSNRIGIFIQYESDSNTVIANTIYRSGRIWSSNEVLYEVDMTKEQYGGLSFQHNILYPRSGNRSTLFQNIIVKGNFHPFISDYNVMCVPYAAQTYSFRVNDVDNSSAISYTLANWRKYSGLDVNSTGIYRSLPSASDTIFYNPTNHDSTIALGSTFRNLDGTVATSPFILHPYCSVILIHGAVVMPTKLTHHH